MITEQVVEMISDIRNAADSACPTEDDIATDKWLGELEALIYTARQSISDDWRANRERLVVKPRNSITKTELDDLFKDLGL
jgi:hypothetical protein